MGSAVQGVLRYRCPCGAAYLVLLDPAGDDDWLAEVRRCGREHVREGDALSSFVAD